MHETICILSPLFHISTISSRKVGSKSLNISCSNHPQPSRSGFGSYVFVFLPLDTQTPPEKIWFTPQQKIIPKIITFSKSLWICVRMVHSQFPASFVGWNFRFSRAGNSRWGPFHPRMTKGQGWEHSWGEKNGRSYPPMMVEVEWPYKETASLGDTPILHRTMIVGGRVTLRCAVLLQVVWQKWTWTYIYSSYSRKVGWFVLTCLS